MRIEKKDFSSEKTSESTISTKKTNIDSELSEKEDSLSQIKESNKTAPRSRQEVVFDISSDLIKDGSELGKFVKEILLKIRILPRQDYINMIPLIESEVDGLKKDATPVAKKHADRLIKRLKIESIIEGKVEKGSDLNEAEKIYKNAEFRFDTAKEDLKQSLRTLDQLTEELPSQYKKKIQIEIKGKEIIDNSILSIVDSIVTQGVVDGKIDSDTMSLFNEFIEQNSMSLSMLKEATKDQMKALDEWDEAA